MKQSPETIAKRIETTKRNGPKQSPETKAKRIETRKRNKELKLKEEMLQLLQL